MPSALLTTSANESTARPSTLAAGAVLQDRYRIVRQLGKGGMGAVYEAVDLRLDTTVALKETFSKEKSLRRQFEQEARLLAQLHHPALPRVSDYFTEGDRAFLVMQFIAGADLAQIIATQPGPFPRSSVIAWADQLLDALIYLHTRDRQIVHRDIKPHNLKLTSAGRIALLDFGLAKAEAADVSVSTSSNSIFGYTRRYSPLEQIQDQGTSPQSDIYALGATLYHLLTGVKPPDALARAAALAKSEADPLKAANDLYPAVGPEIGAILLRAMALSPEDRYPSARDFREALSQLGRKEDQAAHQALSADREFVTDTTIQNKVLIKTRGAKVDPFDSYSILKPDDQPWRNPTASRRPAVIAALLVMLVAGGFATFYGFGNWPESGDAALTYARKTPTKDSTGPAIVHQSKPETQRAKATSTRSASTVNGATGSAGEVNHRNNVQKRRSHRTEITRDKPPDLKPPPFSILP